MADAKRETIQIKLLPVECPVCREWMTRRSPETDSGKFLCYCEQCKETYLMRVRGQRSDVND